METVTKEVDDRRRNRRGITKKDRKEVNEKVIHY